MAKIQTATKNDPKPAVKAVPSEPKVAKTPKAPKLNKDGTPKTKPAPFDRARGRLNRSVVALGKAASYITALAKVLPEDHAGHSAVKESNEGLEEAKNWLNIVAGKLASVPAGTAMPSVKAARGMGASAAAIIIGSKVALREKKAELYDGLFEEGEENTLVVHAIVAGGKRVVCKTPNGIRQVIPSVHLRPAS